MTRMTKAKRIRRYFEERDEIIKQHGRMIQGVFPAKGDPPDTPSFSYTIGNWQKHGLPELLLIGTSRGTYLDELSEMMIERGTRFQNGEVIATGELLGMDNTKYRVRVIDADTGVRHDFTCQVPDAPVQQVILSDAEGWLPGEPGCAEPFASVPILGAPLQ